MNTISESNKLAKSLCDNTKCRYLYGAKYQDYTSALVKTLNNAYHYSDTILKLAYADADKGYKAIDCSGFVCKVLGISNQGSSTLKANAYKSYTVAKSNAKEGMALWKQGHIAYVGADLKIYEACSTSSDMKVSSWENRASAFTNLIVVKGSALEKKMKEDSTTTTTSTTSTSATKSVGDKVTFTGTLYANANGSGATVKKSKATLYIVNISKGSKYPYGLAKSKGGTRIGWAKL